MFFSVAFTSTNPVKFKDTEILAFTDVVTNMGNGYNATTGQFTCSEKGVYMFTFNILKEKDVQTSHCKYELKKNNSSACSTVKFDDGRSLGYGLFVLPLEVGDTVELENCFNQDPSKHIKPQSSFSGVLLSRLNWPISICRCVFLFVMCANSDN